jgi:hypothetical protein
VAENNHMTLARVLGLIPTGWYPIALSLSPEEKHLALIRNDVLRNESTEIKRMLTALIQKPMAESRQLTAQALPLVAQRGAAYAARVYYGLPSPFPQSAKSD